MVVMVDLVNFDGRGQFTKQVPLASTAYALGGGGRSWIDRVPRMICRGSCPAADRARVSCSITILRRRLAPRPLGTRPIFQHSYCIWRERDDRELVGFNSWSFRSAPQMATAGRTPLFDRGWFHQKSLLLQKAIKPGAVGRGRAMPQIETGCPT
jgi:hypothetical protein